MSEEIRSISWEAYEHNHTHKGSDWFWILGIITVALTITSVLLGNTLFALLVFIAGLVMALHANREPQIVAYQVTPRGLVENATLYPYSSLESFYIDEEDPNGPMLYAKSEKVLMPLIIMPLPEEHLDDIEDIIAVRLPEEHLEEPLAHKLLEFFGF